MTARIFLGIRTATDWVRPAACALACVVAACSPQPENHVTAIDIVGSGIMARSSLEYERDETSPIGARIGRSAAVRIARDTDRIPFRLGVAYGLAFVVRGAPAGAPVDIRVVLSSPSGCVLKSSGQTVYENQSTLHVRIGELRHVGATVTDGEESPCKAPPGPGLETFRLYHGADKLAEKTFWIIAE